MSMLANWKEIVDTANLSSDKKMDVVSRWLIITRAAVFSMTMISGLIGGVLAAMFSDSANWGRFSLAFVGLVLAHAANNMINDYFDMEGGVDTDEYTRALYAPHPVLSGLISKRGLQTAILAVNAFDLAILIILAFWAGWPVLVFALLGLFISVFYVAPPLKLKHHGLGEPSVFIVWGPLMIGGAYYATAGAMPPAVVWLACVPYALIVTTVLMGKHIDKIEVDREKGIHTLPVLMGNRAARWLNAALMVAYYLTVVALVLLDAVGLWVLLVFLALPRLVQVLKTYAQPKPDQPPDNYPVWPLWYVSAAFYHNKLAGGLFVLGLIFNWVLPIGARALHLG